MHTIFKNSTFSNISKFHIIFAISIVRIAQADYKTYLKGVKENSDLVTGTIEEMASELQRKFEMLVADDQEIYDKACKGEHFFSYFLIFFRFTKIYCHQRVVCLP